MRAYRYHSTGPDSRPALEDLPAPQPAAGELLVGVRYAALNPVDWKIAAGHLRLLVRGGLPRTMGSDFSGEIAAAGPGVQGWSAGDPVMGFIDPFKRVHGTFAELVPVPLQFVVRRPPQIDARLGGALPCAGVTAVALCNLAQVGPGSRVLVNGAAGGVGHLAVQIAKARGAEVTGVASAARRGFVAGLGAEEFLDYGALPLERWPTGYDAVLDCVPNLPRASHRRLLRRGGHYASTLPGAATYTLDPVANRLGALQRHAVMLQPDPAAFEELARCVQQGRLRCEIAGEFPLAETGRAIGLSRTGHVAGKLIIRVG
jgi:NADPH:quinone reductase-like Zn-dependent oxidoreductase